jgi:hypothetical protein
LFFNPQPRLDKKYLVFDNYLPMKKKDLEQIGQLFNSSFAQIWEHNLEPAFSGLINRMDTLEKRVDGIENKMVTKDYLDKKLGLLRGEINIRIQKIEKRCG